MAVVYAVKSGNWSDTTVWNTGSLPTSADDVYANNFTVTVNQSFSVLSLNTRATTGVNAGGLFNCSTNGNFTFVCDTINAGSNCFFFGALGNYTITANTINASNTGSGWGIQTNAISSNFTINGNVVGNIGVAFDLASANTVVVNGNVYGGVNNTGLQQRGTSNLTINGFCQGSVNGNAYAATLNSALIVANIQKAISINNGAASVFSQNSSPIVSVKEIEQGNFGVVPIQGYVRLSTASGAFYKGLASGSTFRTLSDPADIAGQVPNPSDVRFGVTYQSGAKTGTAYIPTAASVAFGVPVDNTTGTAALTPAAVWNTATSSLTTAGSIGARLKNASTVDTTGDQLAALL